MKQQREQRTPYAAPLDANAEILRSALKSALEKPHSILRIAFSLGVRPTTLQKLLDGQTLSEKALQYVAKALSKAYPDLLPTAQEHIGTLPGMIRELVRDSSSTEKLATSGINPATLKRILVGKPIAKKTQRKLALCLGIPLEHFQSEQIECLESERQPPLSEALMPLIADERCIVELASQTGVNKSTIKKVLGTKEVTPLTEKKLRRALTGLEQADPQSLSNHSAVKALHEVHRLYEEFGTLAAVGTRLRLTRERVRQLLNIGKNLGLFEYKPRAKPDLTQRISRGHLLEVYAEQPRLQTVARYFHVSLRDLAILLRIYSISQLQLRQIRTNKVRAKSIAEYNAVKDTLGHHPTTTEMFKNPQWRTLVARIQKVWGSFAAFRQELGIPKPVWSFRYMAQERASNAAFVRERDLRAVKECLVSAYPLSRRDIEMKLSYKAEKARKLLSLLVKTGEVKRLGSFRSNKTRYELAP